MGDAETWGSIINPTGSDPHRDQINHPLPFPNDNFTHTQYAGETSIWDETIMLGKYLLCFKHLQCKNMDKPLRDQTAWCSNQFIPSLPIALTVEEIRLLQSNFFPLLFCLDKTKTHSLYKESTKKVLRFSLSTLNLYKKSIDVPYLL